MTRIAGVEAVVERLAATGAAKGYAWHDSPPFVLCRLVMKDGLAGTGVTGRFPAAEVTQVLAGPVAEALAGRDEGGIEAIRRDLAARLHPRGGTGAVVHALSALGAAL